jgi:hypothetical protein
MKRKILSVILLNVIVFFALISIHEIVHVVVGMCLGCDLGKAVLLDAKMAGPYAEMVCGNVNQLVLYGSSLLVTACFGLLFLSLKSSGKNLFFVVLGLSLIFSSLDIGLATMQTVIYPLIASGFVFVVLGEYYIASSCINKNLFLDIFELE